MVRPLKVGGHRWLMIVYSSGRVTSMARYDETLVCIKRLFIKFQDCSMLVVKRFLFSPLTVGLPFRLFQ